MNRLLFTCFLWITSIPTFGQEYWQQEVNYTINVTLDDNQHVLRGHEEFEYVNNSPDELSEIKMHIWPNAYRDKNTALAKQLYRQGDDILLKPTNDIIGYIDSLDFKVNGSKINWEYEPYNKDICVLTLPTPLQPGERISVSTPFKVKIPSGEVSRLGHIGQSYQITQWYPKPAVYDSEGWHHMPYLNQGEFFSEFGSFDVSITLPENYVVGATGDLQTASEIEFMNQRAKATQEALDKGLYYVKDESLAKINDYPASSARMKTIRFTQSNVHDFAWFADKRYQVLKGEVSMPVSRRIVTSWALYTPRNGKLWSKAIEYINDGTFYYSKWNGEYPYNQVTAVDGTISAGGGMEYPNVTVIGNSGTAEALEVVIVHEVGHNWFYGQLGSNERVHGWMDEGMNTLNEVRYMQTKYPDNASLSKMVLNGAFHFNDLSHQDMSDIAYRIISGLGEDQPIETHSAKFTQANYGVVMYQKTGLVFYYLKDYLGEELFDKAMHEYYAKWEFKHPQPSDLKASLQESTGKDLSWLFDDLINSTNHVDYKLSSVKRRIKTGHIVKTKNVGQVDGPIEVNALKDGKVVETVWIEPGKKKNEIALVTSDLDAVMIDYGKDIPELNRQNNYWSRQGLFNRVEKPKFEFLIGDNETDRTNVFWSPMIAGNGHDKLMLGLALHNYGVPFNKLNYFVAPMFSFGRKFVSGFSELSYTTQPKRGIKQSKIGVSVKSFDVSLSDSVPAQFIGISPYWNIKIGNRGNKKKYSQSLRIQGLLRYDDSINGGTTFESRRAGGYIQYQFNYKLPDHKFNLKLRNEYVGEFNEYFYDDMARFFAELNYKFKYLRSNDSWLELRAFFGQLYISNFYVLSEANTPYGMSLSGTAGYQDLFLDNYYMGRNFNSGFYSQQRSENMGGFKSTSWYGTTTDWLATTNLYVQLPFRPKIFGVFADYGVFGNGTTNNNSAYNVGLALRLGDVFGLYFPVLMSKELSDSFGPNSKYGEKIRFSLKLNPFNSDFNIMDLFN